MFFGFHDIGWQDRLIELLRDADMEALRTLLLAGTSASVGRIHGPAGGAATAGSRANPMTARPIPVRHWRRSMSRSMRSRRGSCASRVRGAGRSAW